MLKRLMNKAKGIDPFFEEVKAEQIGLYQHYFIKVLQSIDVDVETSWSMGKPYDKERFQKDEYIMEKIIVGEAAAEGLIPSILQVIVHQYFFADVYQREIDRKRWVQRVIHRKQADYFPGGWQVASLLYTIAK
jgi:hypothetical protein